MMGAILEYGYKNLDLIGFELNVYSTNPRPIYCYEKVSFQKNGVGRIEETIHMPYHK